jgi:hypothetical protein
MKDSTPLPITVRKLINLPASWTSNKSDILPRKGKHLSYEELSGALQHAYNLAPSLADQLTSSAYLLDQGRGWIDLHDLNALNVRFSP